MRGMSKGRTNSALIRSQHPRSGQTLQHKREILTVEDVPAARHRPQVPRDPARGVVELHELLLEPELRYRWELAVELDIAARLEVRYDAELPCDHPPTA